MKPKLRLTTEVLAVLLATVGPAVAIHEKNAGPKDVEIRFKLPVPKPLSPEEALKAFRVEEGYRVELVAAEPLVEAPVAMSWDERGRLYVVEMRGYMQDVTGAKDLEPKGRIRLLEDTDGDGRMDKATVFLDGLVLPRAVMAVNGGVLVGEPPQLWFCRDEDGDGKSDRKEAVADDFGSRTGQPEHMANTPVWAMDNAVWVAGWGTRLKLRGGVWSKDSGLGRGQYGLCQDDAGRLFFNYNSDLLRCDLLPAEAFVKNPMLRSTTGVNYRVIQDQSVWPGHPTPGVNRGYEPKTLREDGSLTSATAACGALIYRGDALPDFRGNAFIPEPSGNLVKRAVLKEKDGVVSGESAERGREFLVSTDERFRPVQAVDGPDGALYIADLYRGVLQHSGFLTHYLVANIEARQLLAPLDGGRIWRVVREGGERRKPVTVPAGARERAALLGHANGWVRDTAQRLLVETGGEEVVAAVKAVVEDKGQSAVARLHAMWVLDGLGSVTPEILVAGMRDGEARIRAAAVRMAGREMAAELAAMTDPDRLVQAHLALKLSGMSLPETDAALARLLVSGGAEVALVREAAMTGLRGREVELAKLLVGQVGGDVAAAAMGEMLAGAVGAAGKVVPFSAMLELAASRPAGDAVQVALLKGLGSAGNGKVAKMVWVGEEPGALVRMRGAVKGAAEKALAVVEGRVGWPGKPGVAVPPVVKPLTAEQTALAEKGRVIYGTLCGACHQPHGYGLDGLAPPLVDSEWVLGKPEVAARIVLHGLAGPVKVGPKTWNLAMPPLPQLTDEDIAGVLTYLRREWEHGASPVGVAEVAAVRAADRERVLPWTAEELSGKGKAKGKGK
jgi:mono/diheme cytochrome c family protein/glucose/arabinose dehydrogenase